MRKRLEMTIVELAKVVLDTPAKLAAWEKSSTRSTKLTMSWGIVALLKIEVLMSIS